MRRIVRSRKAKADLDRIWDYVAIEHNNPDAADALLDEIDQAVQLLSDNPGIGTDVSHLANGIRRFVVRQRYLVYYQPRSGGIRVVRILHSANYIHPGYLQ